MSQFKSVFLETAGDGLWSEHATEVKINDIRVSYVNDEQDFGELRVYFDKEDWDVSYHGLIYTDSLFLDQLRSFLAEQGLAAEGVDYSEQGMQGNGFVSLDVEGDFLASWEKKFKDGHVASLAKEFA